MKNIATGVVADNDVNVDNLISIGKRIVCEMEGKDIYKCVLKRKDKVKTMSWKTSMSLQDKEKCIDSHLLFQRLVVLANSSNIAYEYCKGYELSAYPPALFESSTMLLKADKPQITKAVTEFVKRQTNELGTTENIEMHVIDGGSLLLKVSWEKNITYRAIAMKYVKYVCQNFKSGKNCF